MGGLYSKLKDYYSTTVDYGYLKPQGIYRHNDSDMKIVKQLIRKGSLAPFYRGTTDIYSTKKISFETECPICFLFYPSNINKTRCCHKSICTECFLQFKRSSSSPLIPAVCPFCVQPNLGVVYLPPPWSKHYDKLKRSRPDLYTTKKIEPDDPNVIYVDTIRPKWEEMLDDASSSAVGSTRRRRVPLTNEIRRRRRRTDYDETIYDTSAELDLEDVLVMEAIRLSLTHTTN